MLIQDKEKDLSIQQVLFRGTKQSTSSKRIKSSEKGFILLTALIGLVILLALTVLMINISTRDLQISSKNVGTKKAMLAAEAGIQALMKDWNVQNIGLMSISNVQVDPTNDPGTTYDVNDGAIASADIPGSVAIAGFNIAGQTWGRVIYYIEVTGRSNAYKSAVTISTGIGYGPTDITTTKR